MPAAFEDHSNAQSLLDFAVEFSTDGSALVRLAGELDSVNVDELAAMFAGIEATGSQVIDVDVSAVSFASCAVAEVFARHAEACRDRGGRLAVVRCSRPVERVLHLTGWHRVVDGSR